MTNHPGSRRFSPLSKPALGLLIFFGTLALGYVYVFNTIDEVVLIEKESTETEFPPDAATEDEPVEIPEVEPNAESVAEAHSSGSPLVLYDLLDQNDQPFTKADNYRGVVIVFVGQSIRDEATKWSDYMYEHLPEGVVNAKVLDTTGKSKLMKGMITTSINVQKKTDDMKVWLDWEGIAARTYGVSPEENNIVCFDADDQLVRTYTGPFDATVADEIIALYETSEN